MRIFAWYRSMFKVILLFTITVLGLIACILRPGHAGFVEVEKALPQDKSHVFNSFTVDEQLDIYLYAQLGPIEGGDPEYVQYLAVNGESKIHAVGNRIDLEKDFHTKLMLVRALDIIDGRCLCVGKNLDVLDTIRRNRLEKSSADPEDQLILKDLYAKYLDDIELRANK